MVPFLNQPVTVPLWAFITALILPVGWLARQTRRVVKQRVGADG